MQEQREDPQKENAVSGNDADDADELACKPKATSQEADRSPKPAALGREGGGLADLLATGTPKAPEPAAPTPSKRLSNAQLRSSALGGEGHTPRGGLRKESEAPVVETATLPPDAAHHARAMEVGDVADEASNLQHLKELASTREDSLVARIIDEVSGDYDGTDRDEFEALFKKYNRFQKAGMDELRGQLFAMFDRDGDGKVAVVRR